MDDFAQSREPDDLFADEIEPAETAYEAPSQNGNESAAATPQPSQSRQAGRGAQNQRGGRGRGRGNYARGGGQSTRADTTAAPSKPATATETPTETSTIEPVAAADTVPTPAPPTETSRVTSVRGDRSATGPSKPTKRTEAELNELMSSMRLKNLAKTEAHERAEKDQASFLQREQQAAAKRLEERKAIREQNMERAKNRERKIKAQGGREWDSEKMEADIVDRSRGNSSGYMRGAHGGVASAPRGGGLSSSRFVDDEDTSSNGRGRGRGDSTARGRGGRGGRAGRGRGGASDVSTKPSTVPTESDFPALPTSSNPAKSPSPIQAQQSSWAEEMATPIEEKA